MVFSSGMGQRTMRRKSKERGTMDNMRMRSAGTTDRTMEKADAGRGCQWAKQNIRARVAWEKGGTQRARRLAGSEAVIRLAPGRSREIRSQAEGCPIDNPGTGR